MAIKCIMATITRPLLAETAVEFTDIQLPAVGTPKLDGYRCLKVNEVMVSRNFKPIRNVYVREHLKNFVPEGIDGELMLRDKTQSFNNISSAFSSFEGEPDYVFHAFDYVKDSLTKPYADRIIDLVEWVQDNTNPFVEIVPYKILRTEEELLSFEKKCLEDGFEGSMYRTPNGAYKCGRATLNDQILLKKKPWFDSEAILIGFNEQEKNENIKEKNELGLSKRSSKKAGKVPANTLGTFTGLDPNFCGEIIEIGTGKGLTKCLKKEIWDNQGKYLNKIVRYKYQLEGTINKPRFPSWQGFRDLSDIDTDHPIRGLFNNLKDGIALARKTQDNLKEEEEGK